MANPPHPLLAITDAIHNRFGRPHVRVAEIMNFYDDRTVMPRMRDGTPFNVNNFRTNLLQSVLNDLSNWRNIVHASETLDLRRAGPRARFNMLERMYPDEEPEDPMQRGAKYRWLMQMEQPVECGIFPLPVNRLTKEDVIALLLINQATMLNVMFDAAAQQIELAAETGEPAMPRGLIRENNLIVVSPSIINGANLPPIVAQPAQVRFQLTQNGNVTNVKIISVHLRGHLHPLDQIFTEKHRIQAMLLKLVFDRSCQSLVTMTAAQWCTAMGVNGNAGLSPEVSNHAVHEGLPFWGALNDMLGYVAQLARRFQGVVTTAVVRYVCVQERSDTDAHPHPHWIWNNLAHEYFQDFVVGDPYAAPAVNLYQEYFDTIVQPLI